MRIFIRKVAAQALESMFHHHKKRADSKILSASVKFWAAIEFDHSNQLEPSFDIKTFKIFPLLTSLLISYIVNNEFYARLNTTTK